MREYRPYVLPDGTTIPGYWYERPERFVATAYGWKKLTAWGAANRWCEARGWRGHFGSEWHHIYGRGAGKRDDRLPSLRWLCRTHHRQERILRRPLHG